jgi:hypothetical protein
MHKQNSIMMYGFFVLVKNYSLLIRFSHMSQEVDGKSHKEINHIITVYIFGYYNNFTRNEVWYLVPRPNQNV